MQNLVGMDVFRNIPLGLPPLFEQQAIAAALGEVNATIDALDRLIAKKRDIKQAAMQQFLTGRQRLTDCRSAPELWHLGDLGSWRGGGTPSMANAEYWSNGSIPWASSADIKSPILSATEKRISSSALESSATTLIPKGSILAVTRSGILRRFFPVSKSALAVCINQDIKALIPNQRATSDFLLQLLLYHGPMILASCMKAGTTVESIEFAWLKRYEVLIPSVGEQQAIAAVLSDMDAEIAALEARREKSRAIKQGMMQELLTGRTRLV